MEIIIIMYIYCCCYYWQVCLWAVREMEYPDQIIYTINNSSISPSSQSSEPHAADRDLLASRFVWYSHLFLPAAVPPASWLSHHSSSLYWLLVLLCRCIQSVLTYPSIPTTSLCQSSMWELRLGQRPMIIFFPCRNFWLSCCTLCVYYYR